MAKRGFAHVFGPGMVPAPPTFVRMAGHMGAGMGVGMDDQPNKFAKLSAAGWTCPSCGNMNFADRDVCNMRKCASPRPHESVQNASPHSGMMVMGPMHSPTPGPFTPQSPEVMGSSAFGKNMNGGWTCAKCQNKNFADREFCNMRKCGAPRPEALPQEPEPNVITAPASAPPNLLPEGGWTCEGCGSVNFADRETCFMRKCGAVRPGLEGIVCPKVHERLVGGADGRDYGGDWICASCGNSNFQDRAFCNLRNCQKVRQLAEWTCGCGNTNFADRMHCNLRKCRAQRTDIHPKAVAVFASMGKGFGKGSGLEKPQDIYSSGASTNSGVAPFVGFPPMFDGPV